MPGIEVLEYTPEQQKAIDQAAGRLRRRLPLTTLFGSAGTGKALAHGSMVQTPAGPRAIETLRAGEEVFGADGKKTTVDGVYPQGVLPGYRVTFRDGFSVVCSKDHLWTVWTTKLWQNSRAPITLTTGALLMRGLTGSAGGMKFRIPLARPVQYEEATLPVDPYVLGALIGDGTGLGRSVILCTPSFDQFVVEEVRSRVPEWIDIHSRTTEHCNYHHLIDNRSHRSNEMRDAVRDMGLAVRSPERFIPENYLRGSEQQRRDLLAGLMDTDGTCRGNRTEFSTMSPRLASDVAFLVQSLGGVAIVRRYDRGSKGVEFCVNVKMFECPFLLPRKADRWHPTTKNPPSRYIAKIEPAGETEHTCISVNAPDGLFLTDHHIVTHNTTVAKAIAARVGSLEEVAFCAPTGKAALVLRRKGVPATTVHSLIYRPIGASEKELERLNGLLVKEKNEAKAAVLRQQIAELLEALASPSFYKRDYLEESPKAIILDESSMVSGQMLEDLMSFDVPVLALGDPGQLPPVKATTPLQEDGFVPTIMLRTPHRFAERSPVHFFAMRVRERGVSGVDQWRQGSGLNTVESFDLPGDKLLRFDQVICGTNATRARLNLVMRNALGKPADEIDDDDRLVCLRNDPRLGLVNGEQYTVAELEKARIPEAKIMRIEGFCPQGTIPLFAWAYAITCHKAQGSEWGRVCVLDESAVFGRDADRWLYTAITRAADSVVVLRSH